MATAETAAWAKWELVVVDRGMTHTIGIYATEAAAKSQATKRQKSADRYGLDAQYSVQPFPTKRG